MNRVSDSFVNLWSRRQVYCGWLMSNLWVPEKYPCQPTSICLPILFFNFASTPIITLPAAVSQLKQIFCIGQSQTCIHATTLSYCTQELVKLIFLSLQQMWWMTNNQQMDYNVVRIKAICYLKNQEYTKKFTITVDLTCVSVSLTTDKHLWFDYLLLMSLTCYLSASILGPSCCLEFEYSERTGNVPMTIVYWHCCIYHVGTIPYVCCLHKSL